MGENKLGIKAVLTVSEKSNIKEKSKRFNGNTFFTYISYWIITFITMLFITFCIYIMRDSQNIIYDVIKSVDVLNLSFSLTLSTFLEICWNMEKDNKAYKLCFSVLFMAVIIGVVIYLLYSIPGSGNTKCTTCGYLQINNPVLQMSFNINILYLIFSCILILTSFLIRSIETTKGGV